MGGVWAGARKWLSHHDPLYVPSEVDHHLVHLRDLVDNMVSVAPVADLVAPDAVPDNMGLLSVVSLGFYLHDMSLARLVVVVEEVVDLVAFPAASRYLLVFVLVLSQILLLLPD